MVFRRTKIRCLRRSPREKEVDLGSEVKGLEVGLKREKGGDTQEADPQTVEEADLLIVDVVGETATVTEEIESETEEADRERGNTNENEDPDPNHREKVFRNILN